MSTSFFQCLASSLVFSLFTQQAFGHAILDKTLKLRSTSDGIKGAQGPCGAPATNDPNMRNVYEVGQEVEIKYYETIDHDSKYRIGFSKDDTDVFDTVLMDTNLFDNDAITPAMIEAGGVVDPVSGQPVVRQDITGAVADRVNNPREYVFKVKMPDTPCDRCSIQLIQKMFFNGGTSNYFSCMDVRLVPVGQAGNPATPADPAATPGDAAATPKAPTGLNIQIRDKSQ